MFLHVYTYNIILVWLGSFFSVNLCVYSRIETISFPRFGFSKRWCLCWHWETIATIECEESCVARHRHVHLSPDFTSQEFRIEPNVSTTIQSSSSVAIQNRGDVCLSTLWGGEKAVNQ